MVVSDKLGQYDKGYESEGEINNDWDKKSIDSFRTGILGSILIGKGYVYKYARNKKNKQGRVYFSSPILFETNYLLNIVLDGNDLKREDLFKIIEDVVFFIKQEYNNIIERGN